MEFSLTMVVVIAVVVWFAAKADERADIARTQAIYSQAQTLPSANATLAGAVLAVGTAAGLN